jgi:hypothetical protein
MNKQIERECPVCGIIYNADAQRLKFGRQTTCSRVCSYKSRTAKAQRRQEGQCGACGKTVIRVVSHIKSRHDLIFCSPACAYKIRRRIVEKPYVVVATYDRSAAMQKAWQTRRANPKPYPEAARLEAASRCVKRINHGFHVSQFERKAAEILLTIGAKVYTSVPIRNTAGQFIAVFDLYLPLRRMAIECHGTYWHGGRFSWQTPDTAQEKNLLYEAKKLILARSLGIDLRILWEHDFKRDPTGALLAAIR